VSASSTPGPVDALSRSRSAARLLVLGLLLLTAALAALPPTSGSARVAAPDAIAGGTPRGDRVDPEQIAATAEVRRRALQRTGEQVAPEDPAPLSSDGALLRPTAPLATPRVAVAGGIRRYEVRAGDTLTSVANRFGTSALAIWRANRLEPGEPLPVGDELMIPASNGVLHTVSPTDSLDSIAERYAASEEEIVRINGLSGDVLTVGQQLIVPDGRAAVDSTPTPTAAPTATPTPVPSPVQTESADGCTDCDFGGSLLWPVSGGQISQGYHGGHQAIDIAAPYGRPVVAAAPGTVIFAGWKNNGGGWQVWLDHRGVITTYNHMSSLAVSGGSFVAAGQRVGRIGATGWATGPHLHFDVWIGHPWKGGYRVNPLAYF
jgi:murein DD-endopeptidase MepM/ murein hydrolase activator NlpD